MDPVNTFFLKQKTMDAWNTKGLNQFCCPNVNLEYCPIAKHWKTRRFCEGLKKTGFLHKNE